MLKIIGYAIFIIYCGALAYITLYCLAQLHLLWAYRSSKRSGSNHTSNFTATGDYPFVTIQLPLYNEMYVVERLIDNICRIDYPREKLEIQILDDSDDNTTRLAAAKASEYAMKGFNIRVIRRPDRQGYKAGALQYGMETARGDYIAIFDADFLPKPDFLIRTIPYFADERVGVVQAKWEHINQEYSLITRLQAFQLNVHFTVEQAGRQASDLFLQFNGTAGIWRRETIEDAGGWQSDTLTEDLDLSYRAQLNGWVIRYLQGIGAPAELPAEMNGLKSQQFRWMKGGAETARKMLPRLWRSGEPVLRKVHGTLHLLSSSIFVFVFVVGVVSVPLVFVLKPLGIDPDIFAIFLLGLLTIAAVYYVGNRDATVQKGSVVRNMLKFVFLFPLFLALSMGLSMHNAIAVIQGYLGKRSAFVRTPKFDIRSFGDSFVRDSYRFRRISTLTVMEGLLALYFLAAFIAAIYFQDTTFIVFHLLLAFGYGTICFYSLRHARAGN